MKKILIAVLTLLLTATLLLSVTNTTAQVEEAVEVVSIPDANLAEAIREALGLPSGAAITSDAMLKLTELLTWGSVTDLTGLEYATNLTGLNLDNQPISNLSPIAGLIQLEWLGLSHTDVSDISPLASLSQLRSLDLGKFRSRDLGTGASESLRLSYGHTDVSDISPLSALTQLERLFLGHTGISDISPLSALTQLKSLDLRSTGVSDISPLVSLTQLVKLNLVDCPLNADAHQTHIPTIQANGTEVAFDPFKPIHLPPVPWLVSLIYFRPSDIPVRPNVDAEIDALIKKAQRFFADQLELHGFGRKTFQFETDAHGNAVVHHVNGKFPRMHYVNNGKYKQEIKGQMYISQKKSVTVYMLGSDPWFFTESGGIGGGGNSGGLADIDYWHWKTIAHELAHAFGLQHDWRTDANAKRIRTFTDDRMLTSFCAAEWLSVHPAFNPGQPVSTSNATIKMLPPTLASPPNTIRIRFEVTDLDGLHQAQLQIPDFVVYSGQYKHMVDCKRLNGRHSTVEFVTTKLTPQIKTVTLCVIDVLGHMSSHSVPIDVASLLPPAKVVSIPDPNLASAVREALELSMSEAITTHAMLPLRGLWVPNRGIKDLTGLEHATNLTALDLSRVNTSGGGFVDSNAISDWSPLAGLTQLERLDLSGTAGLDISPLASLTQLERLDLTHTGVSDISPLTTLTQLTSLSLSGTGVSDISSLTALTQLERLDLSGTGVSDISPLTTLTQLTSLSLSGTGVSDISSLTALTQLERLDLSGTGVSDISPLTTLTQLERLDLSGTGVSVSSLTALTQLRELNLTHTGVSDISPLTTLTQLNVLSLRSTGVSDISSLTALTQLERLDLSGTAGLDISPLASLTQLERLDLTHTGVSDISPLTTLTQLRELNLAHTGVSDISPLTTLTQLNVLSLSGTGVLDISPLSAFFRLERLSLSGTGVLDISPLSALSKLKVLSLNDTGVSDISPLTALTQLTLLFITDTDVADVSPLLEIRLGTVLLEGCPLSYASIHTHIPAMQAKGIRRVEFDNVAHPALLKTFGEGQEGEGGEALPKPFVVAAMDEHGKPLVGKTVQFENLQGGGMLSATAVKTDARGKARVTLTLGRAPGMNKVKASSEGIQSWVLFTAVGTGATPQLVADVNGDGVVDLADLAIVAQTMGKPVENPQADVNGDGVVDGEDFALVAANLGEGEAAAPSQAALPAGLTLEKVEWALNLLHAENTGSPAFRRGIAKLEGFLARLIPDKTLLLANYPNPFNPETWIPYQLANPAEVTVTIYAANGAVVRTLDFGHRRAGSYASRSRAAYWDGRNAQGEPVASGVYFYTLTAGDFAATRKMLILK